MHIYLVLIPKEDYMYINNQLATQIVETVKDICDSILTLLIVKELSMPVQI